MIAKLFLASGLLLAMGPRLTPFAPSANGRLSRVANAISLWRPDCLGL
jgi:hypothetical protein